MKKTTILLFLLLIVFDKIYCQEITSGVWLNAHTVNQADFKWLDKQNANNKTTKPDPWVGVRLDLVWGEVHLTPTTFNFDDIVKVLNKAQNHICRAPNCSSNTPKPYKVILTISDKFWSLITNSDPNNPSNWKYNDPGGPIPDYLDNQYGTSGKITNSCDFDVNPKGDCKDPFNPNNPYFGIKSEPNRIITQSYISGKGWWTRKYGSKRWSTTLKDKWLNEFWPALANYEYAPGKKIKNHPALYAIVTPESSFPGLSKLSILTQLGYPGANWYVNFLTDQANSLKNTFANSNVKIISSINWITPNKKPNTGYYQDDASTKLSALNNESQTQDYKIGWFAQDLTNKFGDTYGAMVYPQFSKFPGHLRFAMVTGESHGSKFPPNSPQAKANGILNIAKNNGVHHLLFNTKRDNASKDNNNLTMYTIINNAKDGDYPFLPSKSTLSVEDIKFSNETSISPNPIKTNFTIILKDETLKKVIIYDSLGKKVLESFTTNINATSLSKGIYMVKIISKSEKTTTKKIIKI